MGSSGSLPDPVECAPPPGVVRVARRGQGLFSPPPWETVRADGTLGGRFADPRPWDGTDDGRFRIVYAATTREAAFGEVLASLRPPLTEIGSVQARAADVGIVANGWREHRRIGEVHLAPALRFADISAHRSLTYLRAALAPLARELDIDDVDLSAVAGPQRRFTQTCALLLYEMRTAEGTPRYAGIRYTSRLSASWECWAIFADRLAGVQSLPRPISADDPDLAAAASHLGLIVEGSGSG